MTSFVAVMIVKATVVLFFGCVVALGARKADASVRHGIWALTLAAALGLPLGMIATPSWRVALLPAASSLTNEAASSALTNAVISSPAVAESPASVASVHPSRRGAHAHCRSIAGTADAEAAR